MKLFKISLGDDALTTAWITMLIFLLVGAMTFFIAGFPDLLSSSTIVIILLTSGIVGVLEAFYERGDGLGIKIMGHRITNIITGIGAMMSVILAFAVWFNIVVVFAVLSVGWTFLIQFVILLAEGVVKRW
mgnify:CR=1 FL=1